MVRHRAPSRPPSLSVRPALLRWMDTTGELGAVQVSACASVPEIAINPEVVADMWDFAIR